MSSHKVETVVPFPALPVSIYKTDLSAYPWPKKNKCGVCGIGKFKRIPNTNVLVCRVCGSQYYIPFRA